MSGPVKRSLTIEGHRTSISLEPVFWDLLQEISEKEHIPLSRLVARIDEDRIGDETAANLSSAIRTWLVKRLLAERKS